jgi:hypothetical protein
MVWKLSTREKKSCTQIEFWKHPEHGLMIKEIGWRWCWATYQDKPDLSDYNPATETVELYELGDVIDMEQDDGCWEDRTWPEGMDEEETERLEECYQEDFDEGLENEGWELYETEYWVSGELDLEEVED